MTGVDDKRTMLGYDIDLGELSRTIAARRKLVLGSMLGIVALAIVYLHLAVYTYTATFMVSPVMSSSQSGADKLGGLKGLASLAGINMSEDPATMSFMLYQQGLYSRDVADALARNPDIMHGVFREQWDAAGKHWIPPSGPVSALATVVKDILGIPNRPWQPPDGALLQEFIVDHVAVQTDSEKPVITITYRDEDPQFAVKLLGGLDRAVDNKLRDIALVRANQYLDYLFAQLKKVTNTDVRESLMTTLTDQQKIKMMASATAPYAAQPFGQPSASRKPTRPMPFLVLAVAAFTGLLFGVLGAVWLPPLRWPRGVQHGSPAPEIRATAGSSWPAGRGGTDREPA